MPDASISQRPTEYLPEYLREVYSWAYLTPWSADLLDQQWVVQTILWGNAQKLIDRVLAEVRPGDRVLQPAAVYGDFSRQVAQAVGSQGHLTVRDIASLQIELTRKKLADLSQVSVDWGDAEVAQDDRFDLVTCFFLLHEVPDTVKRGVTEAMLDQLRPGGKAVFVDYHEPSRFHPLKPLMRRVFRHLEPFATGLWRCEIESLAGERAARFTWQKSLHFGGLYQIVIAEA